MRIDVYIYNFSCCIFLLFNSKNPKIKQAVTQLQYIYYIIYIQKTDSKCVAYEREIKTISENKSNNICLLLK